MVLLLLPVEGVADVAIFWAVEREQLCCCDGGERNPFVGGAEEEVEVVAEGRVRVDGVCVGVGETGEEGGGREETGVEEVGGDAAGFERVAAEGEDFGAEDCGEEGLFEGGEGGGYGSHWEGQWWG